MRLALDIGNRQIRMLALDGNRVHKYGTAPLESGLVTDGHILQPQKVAAAIVSLFKSISIPYAPVYAALSGLSSTYRLIRLPRMAPPQMEEAVERAARKEIPLPLEDIYLSWQVIATVGEEVDVFVVGVQRMYINALVETMQFAGIKLAGVDLKGLTLARAAGRTNALIVNFEPDCFDIVIVAGGLPSVLHTVSPKAEGVSNEDRVSRLVDEISRTVSFYNITHADNSIKSSTPLLLSGELGLDEPVRRLIQTSIEYPLEPLKPQVESKSDFPVSHYTGNIGLAIKPSGSTAPRTEMDKYYDVNIDLLAGKRRLEVPRISLKQRFFPAVIIISLILIAALLPVRYRMHAETVRLTGQTDRLDRELRMTRVRIDEAAQTEAAIRQIAVEITKLNNERESIIGKGVAASDATQTLVSMFPVNGNLVSIQIDTDEITINGETDSRAAVIAYAGAITQLNAYTDVRIALIDERQTDGAAAAGFVFSIVLTR